MFTVKIIFYALKFDQGNAKRIFVSCYHYQKSTGSYLTPSSYFSGDRIILCVAGCYVEILFMKCLSLQVILARKALMM